MKMVELRESRKAAYRSMLMALERPLTDDEKAWLAWFDAQRSPGDAALSEGS